MTVEKTFTRNENICIVSMPDRFANLNLLLRHRKFPMIIENTRIPHSWHWNKNLYYKLFKFFFNWNVCKTFTIIFLLFCFKKKNMATMTIMMMMIMIKRTIFYPGKKGREKRGGKGSSFRALKKKYIYNFPFSVQQ